MAINPTKQDYINALLDDNRSYFAFIEQLKERIKTYENRRKAIEQVAKTDKDICDVISLTGKIIGLYTLIRLTHKDINKNLAKIEGLRNGTIKEI